jgi:predicted transcriptional regulator
MDEARILLLLSRGAKTRLKIIRTLFSCPRNCHQIASELKTSWWTIYKHLQHLEKAGLIRNISLGHIRFYALTSKGKSIFTKIDPEKTHNSNLAL